MNIASSSNIPFTVPQGSGPTTDINGNIRGAFKKFWQTTIYQWNIFLIFLLRVAFPVGLTMNQSKPGYFIRASKFPKESSKFFKLYQNSKGP